MVNGERVFQVQSGPFAYSILTSRLSGLLGVPIRLRSHCEMLQ